MGIFYKPPQGYAGDFIPFYHDGLFYLFYLQDWRDPAHFGEGTPWYLVTTPDFVHFREHGEMLARGPADGQDRWVFTGSVIEGEGMFHIFYTGHNSHFTGTGRPVQAVMHAVSADLLHWQKLPADTFFAPPERFEADDWRDPFVFWNASAREYWMLLAARQQQPLAERVNPSRRRGCTALATSPDLRTWTVREPVYAPGLYFTHECPDLFSIGEWTYLLFSEFTERTVTRYRVSPGLSGPWIAPAVDSFDGRAFYAAKTAATPDGRRFLFGWNPTREGETDRGAWQWGGSLVVHEVFQNDTGTLGVRLPESVAAAYAHPEPFQLVPALGECAWDDGRLALQAGPEAQTALAAARSTAALPAACRLDLTVELAAGTQACGVLLRASPDLETGYMLRLEPYAQRMVLDAWPRPGDIPFWVELERPLALGPGEAVQITILLEDSLLEVYAGGQVALSARLYDHPTGLWGVFAQEGSAWFSGLSLRLP